MVAFSTVLLALSSAATSVLASPVAAPVAPVNITEEESGFFNLLSSRGIQPGTGTHNGFFYSYWTDGRGSINYNNEVSSPLPPKQPPYFLPHFHFHHILI